MSLWFCLRGEIHNECQKIWTVKKICHPCDFASDTPMGYKQTVQCYQTRLSFYSFSGHKFSFDETESLFISSCTFCCSVQRIWSDLISWNPIFVLLIEKFRYIFAGLNDPLHNNYLLSITLLHYNLFPIIHHSRKVQEGSMEI